MSKWKCEICGKEFDNFHAQGFDNKIYCPLCYFKKENQALKNQQKEFIEYLENEKNRLAKECSHTYEDSLGKLLYVNEDIFNEINKILSKYKEIIGGDNK